MERKRNVSPPLSFSLTLFFFFPLSFFYFLSLAPNKYKRTTLKLKYLYARISIMEIYVDFIRTPSWLLRGLLPLSRQTRSLPL